LFLAWAVSRAAFTEMLSTVENITAPNERLRIVHDLAGKISAMDQLQKKEAIRNPGNYSRFFKQSKQMRKVMDTLKNLYSTDSIQLVRIASVEQLLVQRDKQFVNYLKVRELLVSNKSFSRQVKSFNALVTKNAARTDSTIVTSEQKTMTTTLVPEPEDKRGFLGKLFSRRKLQEPEKSFRIVNEENIKRDTIALTNDGSMVKDLKRSLRAIETTQKQNSASFIDREAELATANTELINEMLNILRKVENEAVAQIEESSFQAKRVVNTGISRISMIMLVFFGLTIVLLYFILTDITKSNRYRKALETARDEAEFHGRAKQRFLSNMSHEIRTPLQSIIGYSELIRQQIHPQRKDIDAIYYSSEHLLQIVNEILDYNRIVSGKFTFATESFPIRNLLEEVILILQPQAEKKALQLKTNFELDSLGYISGDPFRLKQILLNLIGNAIKFTEKGTVSLSAFYKRKGDDLHFTFIVNDTGIGFSDQDAAQIFGEFEQTERQGTSLKEGAGLGLAIVKALVEGQGGRIYAKSKLGQGSSFTVYLRFTQAEQPQTSKVLPMNLDTKMEVWVVDDDQLILDLCSLILSRNGIRVRCFNSPKELLALQIPVQVRYILMDLRMPELSGTALFELLKPKLSPDVSVFAVTAQVLPEERTQLLDQGFNGVVMKPFREHELLSLFKTVDETNPTFTDDPAIVPEAKYGEEVVFDPSYLKKMTFGDQEQLRKILDRFVEDTEDDMEALKSSVSSADVAQASLFVHRLAGRIAQIGSRRLAAEFRKVELRIRETPDLRREQQEEVTALMPRLTYLVSLVKNYNGRDAYSIS
jgi:signal transduction histidine kinase/DNA-binding NarL/FixJ family response regulator